MKKIKIRGLGILKERNIEIMVDDEDFELLNQFEWKGGLTPNNKIRITTNLKRSQFEHNNWFGVKIYEYRERLDQVPLSKLMNIMLYGLKTFGNCGVGNLKFVDGNELNFTKDNLINTSKYVERLSNEEITKRKEIMMKKDVKDIEDTDTETKKSPEYMYGSYGWGNINKPEYTNQSIDDRPVQNKNPNNNGVQYITNNQVFNNVSYLIIRKTKNGIVAKPCGEETLGSMLALILPEANEESLELVTSNIDKDNYHFEYTGSDDICYLFVIKYRPRFNINNDVLQKLAKFADESYENEPDDIANCILNILNFLYIV